MNSLPRQRLNSSDIASIGFDEASGTLEIEFHATGHYRYFSVPKSLYDQLLGTPSPGKFFRQHIKGKFAWEKLPA